MQRRCGRILRVPCPSSITPWARHQKNSETLSRLSRQQTAKDQYGHKQTTHSVRLTSRIRPWKNLDYSLQFRDLESKVQSQTVLFANNDLSNVYDQKFQVLSPLRYCMQIRLNDTEFEERDGQLTTLRTSRKITFSYYHRASPSTVQVCADQYMKKSDKNIGMKVSHSKFYLYILLIFGCWALFAFS